MNLNKEKDNKRMGMTNKTLFLNCSLILVTLVLIVVAIALSFSKKDSKRECSFSEKEKVLQKYLEYCFDRGGKIEWISDRFICNPKPYE